MRPRAVWDAQHDVADGWRSALAVSVRAVAPSSQAMSACASMISFTMVSRERARQLPRVEEPVAWVEVAVKCPLRPSFIDLAYTKISDVIAAGLPVL
ncbi:MAG: hypothetical protein ACLVKA_08615 [Collinsella aerofaciens]